MMNYYTYAYLREDRTPYYIGKGIRDRIYSNWRRVKPPKDRSRIIFLKQNLTEEEAFKHERYMIAVFGRKDNGTGILRNLTDGGDGTSNRGTPEQRSEISRKAQASRTPEQRREIARKAQASISPEKRSEIAKKRQASKTIEQRREIARKGQASISPEKRSEIAKKREAKKTPEQRSEAVKKVWANRTQEQRSEMTKEREANINPERRTCNQRWQCTETGYVTSPGSLSGYQKVRGIDTSKRIRLS